MLFNQIATSMIGRQVEINKAGHQGKFVVVELSQKTGKMKDGKDGSYVILNDIINDKEMELHPRAAKILFDKGETDGMTLLADVNSAADQQQFDEIVSELVVPTIETKPFDQKQFIQDCVNAVLIEDQQLTLEQRFTEDKTDTNYPIFGEKFETTTEQPKQKDAATTEPKINKKSVAVAIAKKGLETGAKRMDTIALMISEAGLTKPGASTYYQNVKSKLKGWT